MTDAEFNALPIDQKVAKWQEAEKYARQWADIEKVMRANLFGTQFPTPKPGTNKVRLGFNNADGEELALVADHKFNYTVDRPGWLAALKAKTLSDELANKVVSWSAKVKDAGYRGLSADDMKIVSPFITEKPGTPALEIKIASSLRW